MASGCARISICPGRPVEPIERSILGSNGQSPPPANNAPASAPRFQRHSDTRIAAGRNEFAVGNTQPAGTVRDPYGRMPSPARQRKFAVDSR